MMISQKARYALKALSVLTERYRQGLVLIAEIADKENISRKFLASILLVLRNNGVLQSQKGKNGGYMLRIPPEQVSIAKILRIIDGPYAPPFYVSSCFLGSCKDCPDQSSCDLRKALDSWQSTNQTFLDKITLADLCRVNERPRELRG
jgi:Rrf2 family protein